MWGLVVAGAQTLLYIHTMIIHRLEWWWTQQIGMHWKESIGSNKIQWVWGALVVHVVLVIAGLVVCQRIVLTFVTVRLGYMIRTWDVHKVIHFTQTDESFREHYRDTQPTIIQVQQYLKGAMTWDSTGIQCLVFQYRVSRFSVLIKKGLHPQPVIRYETVLGF